MRIYQKNNQIYSKQNQWQDKIHGPSPSWNVNRMFFFFTTTSSSFSVILKQSLLGGSPEAEDHTFLRFQGPCGSLITVRQFLELTLTRLASGLIAFRKSLIAPPTRILFIP